VLKNGNAVNLLFRFFSNNDMIQPVMFNSRFKPVKEKQATVDSAALPIDSKPLKTILVADDDPMVRDIIRLVLEESYSVIDAEDGLSALEIIKDRLPDLIICDIKMPRMTGCKLLKTVKKDQTLNHIPVILMTGQGSEDVLVDGMGAGADDYISKPFNFKELSIRVGNLLKLRAQEKELKRLNEELKLKVSRQLETIVKNERLKRFFPAKLVGWILSSEQDLELTSEKKNLTIFFSDLSGFTELTERFPPELVTNILNEYFTEMVKIADHYEGTFDKFIGDGLMVFFGAPEPMPDKEQAVRAVAMAVAMHREMNRLTRKWTEQGISHNIKIRMGIHQDTVMAGNFGSSQLMEFTVIGSGVNLANRLESYCETGKILVSKPVYSHTKEMFIYKEIVEQVFRGFERLVPVAELDPANVSVLPEF
jgi:two-component system, sensor histidine kinase ChiS